MACGQLFERNKRDINGKMGQKWWKQKIWRCHKKMALQASN
jgi:hypothetical protein